MNATSTAQPDGRSAETAALEGLYERYSRRVFAFCLARLRTRDDAEDAVQTTFLYALGGLRRGVVPAVEQAWLFKIANNVCLSRFDSARRRRKVEFASDPQSLAELAPAREDDRTDASELTEALARLPVQQRRALLLREWRGLSYAEIANELGTSESAVETLLFRARRRFARELRDGRDEAQRTGLDLASLLGWAKSIFSAGVPKLAAAALAVGSIGAVTASIEHQSHRHRPPQPAIEAAPASALTSKTGREARLAVPTTHKAVLTVPVWRRAALRIPGSRRAALIVPATRKAALPASVPPGEVQFKTDASSSSNPVTTAPSSTPQRSALTAPPSRGAARLSTPPALPNHSRGFGHPRGRRCHRSRRRRPLRRSRRFLRRSRRRRPLRRFRRFLRRSRRPRPLRRFPRLLRRSASHLRRRPTCRRRGCRRTRQTGWVVLPVSQPDRV